MEKLPLVSILMPCYNSEKYITKAISSIQNQSYKHWELLICDDASIDNSLEIIRSFESNKIKIFENKTNKGYLKTCNYLFEQAQGEFITFQDSDDYSELNRIELLLTAFDNNSELGACGTQFNFMTDDGKILPEDSPTYPLKHTDIVSTFMEAPGFCGASVMVKKEVIDKIGIYNEYWDRIGAEDHYWLYLISEQFEISNISETLYYYRHNPNSLTRNKTTPRKIHCHDFLIHFFQQRKDKGTDDISSVNFEAIKKMELYFLAPYTDDPTYIFKRLLDWSYTEKDYKAVFKHIFSALKIAPFNLYWYRTLFYYAKKVYL